MGSVLALRELGKYQYQREIPVVADADIVVVGGGPSGVMAAVAAGRRGAKTILIERLSCLGGMLTNSLVLMIATVNDGAGNYVIRGLCDEFLQRLAAVKGLAGDPRIQDWNVFDPEKAKTVLEEMLAESGVPLLYDTRIVDTVVRDRTITSVVAVNKSGLQLIRAGVVVDATGDADVAYRAGVSCEKETGKLQPMTLSMRVTGVEFPDWPEVPQRTKQEYARAMRKAVVVPGQSGFNAFPLLRKGECWLNKTRLAGDATSPSERTRALLEGRRQALEILDWYRKNVPGFEDAELLQTGNEIGVRETRRIVGKYRLEEEDLIGCRKFSDSIARGHYSVDLHRPSGGETDYRHIPNGDYYTIPYRALIPRGFNNIIVAGRIISGSHEAAGSYRVTSHCMATGHAAGVAAAIAASKKTAIPEIHIPELQEQLTSDDALI